MNEDIRGSEERGSEERDEATSVPEAQQPTQQPEASAPHHQQAGAVQPQPYQAHIQQPSTALHQGTHIQAQQSTASHQGNPVQAQQSAASHQAAPGQPHNQHVSGGGTGWGPVEQAPKPRQNGPKSFIWGIMGVVVGVVVAIAGLSVYANMTGSSSSGTSTSNGTIDITVEGDDATLAEVVAAKCLPSVVSIDVYTTTSSDDWGNLFGLSNGSDQEADLEATSLGSGVIISEDGYILTNNHVIADGDMYIVHFDDDTTAEAELVGADSSSDIAVLKVDRTGLTAMEIADSDSVVVGEWVMAIGSPFGLTRSVSEGIVAALYRNQSVELESGTAIYANMIQIDCDINPGNSGGALVDSNGELIGINTMISTTSGSSAGVGFAIPSNYAMDIAQQLIDTGTAVHPYLGVTLGTVDAATQYYYDTTADSGAYVASVVAGSPAETSGLQEGDVIVSYNGDEITTASELIIDVRGSSIGDTVELGVIRNGEEITISVTLAADSALSQ